MEKTNEGEANLVRLRASIDANPDDPSHHFNLGLFLWERGVEKKEVKEEAMEHFLISAKLNPHNGAAFRFLGHYYSRVSVDTQRALKCYQRAVTLIPDDSESGEAICDMLDEEGKETLEVAVCQEASEKSPRAFWAFRRLGYLQLHQKKWSEAVQSFQHAIRGYVTCADLWEALGLAYQRLGMFTAAIKSYGRTVELEASRTFALVESGNILLMLGSFKKGVEQFRLALEVSPQNMSALYGLASGLLSLSKEYIKLGAFSYGASVLEEASEVARTSTCLAGNIACLRKLHGDVQLTYAKCFPWTWDEGLEISEQAFKNSILSWKRSRCSAAISAAHSYQRALHLAPWQPNIYTDLAIASDLVCSLNESPKNGQSAWQLLPEKMCLGGLLLDGEDYEYWVALACLSHHTALKQHALIRALQLDASLAVAWAFLGKLYKEEGEKQLAMQAFDRARSIDPMLALPWAGMSADSHARDIALDEAYESCLRAVQILPLAEFQIGLGKLALFSGHSSSSQVFGAIKQAVQRGPHYPESHNLHGLICEARSDYQSAASAYRLARCLVTSSSGSVAKSHLRDLSFNLARSYCKAGNALEAVKECEDLKKEGLLDTHCLQIYALSLCQLGKKELALSVTRTLASTISSMEGSLRATSTTFICRLLYYISGAELAITSILKMPKELFQSSKISFVVSAIDALDQKNHLDSIASFSRNFLSSQKEITQMHFLRALGKLIKYGSGHSLGLRSGVEHLKKALHMFPNSNLLRNLLGYLFLSSGGWTDAHTASRCCNSKEYDIPPCSNEEENGGLKSASEVIGATSVACYAIGNKNPIFSFPTCGYHSLYEPVTIRHLQKWLHAEPWNTNARYLIILNLLQKAREEKFPRHLSVTAERLIPSALSDRFYSDRDVSWQYQKSQLLLCGAELSLQCGDHIGCINQAKNASLLSLPNGYLFYAHLMLCRAYAAENNLRKLQEEYVRCLDLRSDCHVGWMCLKFIESRYQLRCDSNSLLELSIEECFKEGSSWNMWMAVFNLVQGLISLWDEDFLDAEEFFSQACSLAGSESCLFLCHGAICMELARQRLGPQFLQLAVRNLTRAQKASLNSLPIVSALLAQAEGSLGSKTKWEKNLRFEWFSWPPEMRPAELFFQMHLLANQSTAQSDSPSSIELDQSPQRWLSRAIHLNPSCLRYWKVLHKFMS